MTSRLAILTLDFPPDVGGVQTYLYEVGRRLGKTHNVYVITPAAGDLPPDIPISRVQPSPCNVIGFWRALRRIAPEHVIVGHANPQLLMAALLAGRRYSVIVHGNDFLAAQRCWHAPIFNRLLKRADRVIANSNVTRERLRVIASLFAVTVHPGTDPMVFTPPARPPLYPPRLISVGRLVPRKGIDVVLKALPTVREVFPDIHYDIVGIGPDCSRLEPLAREQGLEANVSFLGRISNEELRAMYHQSHVFVMPSREEPDAASIEGFGIVYLEASASGLPVVAGRSGGVVEAVKHGETGYLVDPHNPDELADVLLMLLQNRTLREKMGRAGRRWVEEEMNWDRTAKQIQRLLAN